METAISIYVQDKGLKNGKNYGSSSAFRGNGLLEDNMETTI